MVTTTYDRLPDTLKSTRGPRPNDIDPECPICRESIPPDALTVEHPGCGQRYDDGCIREWLRSADSPIVTCPICRATLAEDKVALQQRHEAAELDSFIDTVTEARQRWPRVTVPRVASSFESACALFHAAAPTTPLSVIRERLLLQRRASVVILREEGAAAEIPMASTADLVSRVSEFTTDPVSFENLWLGARLVGVQNWILSQIEEAPGLGVYMPWVPTLHIANEGQMLMMPTRDSDFYLELCSIEDRQQVTNWVAMCGQALPTQTICDLIHRFELRDPECEASSNRRSASYLDTIARSKRIIHWILSYPQDQNRFNETWLWRQHLQVLPWPRLPMPGHTYPHTLTDRDQSGSWNPYVDATMLDAVVQQQITPPPRHSRTSTA